MRNKWVFYLVGITFFVSTSGVNAQFSKFQFEIDSHSILDLEHSSEIFTTFSVVDSVIALGKTYLGKPYKYKTNVPWPLDCSGYLAFLYSKFNVHLPRSSRSLFNQTQGVDLNQIQKGDFLFFKGRNLSDRTVSHVSMVVEVNENSIKMMHSCSRGIIIDDYDKSNYYKQRFLKAGRLSPVSPL